MAEAVRDSGRQRLSVLGCDAEAGQETLTLKGHSDDVRGVAFSPSVKIDESLSTRFMQSILGWLLGYWRNSSKL